jgi:hypothetical protein
MNQKILSTLILLTIFLMNFPAVLSTAQADSRSIICELDRTTIGSTELKVVAGSSRSNPFTDRFRIDGKAGDFGYIVSMDKTEFPDLNTTLFDQVTGIEVQNTIDQESLNKSQGSAPIQISAIPASGQYNSPSDGLIILSCGLR